MPRVVMFSGNSATDRGIWITDGTVAGTGELAVARPLSLDPSNFAPFDGKVVFSGPAGSLSNAGLWVTDGTALGTTQLTGAPAEVPQPAVPFNIEDPPHSFCVCTQITQPWVLSPPANFTRLGSELLFTNLDTAGVRGLWTTDGTASGTTELSVAGGSSHGLSLSLFQQQFGSLGGKALFSAYDTPNHFGLWATDGTGVGTVELAVAGASALGFGPTDFAQLGGRLVFFEYDAGGSQGLWTTDGTAAGTVEIVNGTGSYGFSPSFVPFGNKLIFSWADANNRLGIWVTDGTTSGTMQISVAGAAPAGQGLNSANFTAIGSKLLFSGTDASYHYGLWVTDGTGPGTTELAVAGGSAGGVNPIGITAFGTKALFNGSDAAGHRGLFVTDGTASGTAELVVAGARPGGLDATNITALGDKALFNAFDADDRYGLWVTDGTGAGTTELTVAGADPANNGLNPQGLTVADITTPIVYYTDTTTGTASTAASSLYTGPVSYLAHQFRWSGPDSVAIAATSANVFLHGGAGNDALTAVAGSNVLDGGLGSNFLTGATGADGGTDTFFVDARSAGETWSTANNFHHGDGITLWGFVGGTSTGFDPSTHPGSFVLDGTTGYQGATIHSETNGAGTGINASVTIAGLSVAEAAAKLTLSTGSVEGQAYLFISYTG